MGCDSPCGGERYERAGLDGYPAALSGNQLRSGEATDRASEIYLAASALLEGVMKSPVRLIGISLQNLSEEHSRQLTFSDLGGARDRWLAERWKERVMALQQKYAVNLFPSGTETQWEEHLYDVISLMRERITGR